jgi:hypothetical protein
MTGRETQGSKEEVAYGIRRRHGKGRKRELKHFTDF